jgi:cell wall-associated NlpC family hydrolase
MLSFGSTVTIARNEGSFAVTASRFFVPQIHLAPIGTFERDFVAIAERFINVPYLWGGKTSLGLDCSALVQLSLSACGTTCPRDSYMQEATLGTPVDAGAKLSGLQRGDLVFWKGHVAIAYDNAHLIHPNAFHMAVAIEPVSETLARFMKSSSAVTRVRRLSLQT